MPIEVKQVAVMLTLFTFAGSHLYIARNANNIWLKALPALCLIGLGLHFLPDNLIGRVIGGFVFIILPTTVAYLHAKSERDLLQALPAFTVTGCAIIFFVKGVGLVWSFAIYLINELDYLKRLAINL